MVETVIHLGAAARTVDAHENWHILALGLLFAAADAFGIGSNDVANSFATSVGSGSLTLRAACIIAVFTEFTGAVLLGDGVTKTIKGSIIQLGAFDGQSDTLMLAMLCALVGSSLWVNLATRMGMAVSTSHSIVGATIGVGIAFRGPGGVLWGDARHGIWSIVLSWVVSPLLAGTLGALMFTATKVAVLRAPDPHARMLKLYPVYVAMTFGIVSFFMVLVGAPRLGLSHKTAGGRYAIQAVGPVVGVTLALASLAGAAAFFAQRTQLFARWLERLPLGDAHQQGGAAAEATEEEPPAGSPAEGLDRAGAGVGAPGEADQESEGRALLAGTRVDPEHPDPHPRTHRHPPKGPAGRDAGGDSEEAAVDTGGGGGGGGGGKVDGWDVGGFDGVAWVGNVDPVGGRAGAHAHAGPRGKVAQFLLSGVEEDVLTPTDEAAVRAHGLATRYDPYAERLFTAVQARSLDRMFCVLLCMRFDVFTASFASLAHGSNDVANAIAPLSVIQFVWAHGGSRVDTAFQTPLWCLVYGAIFIDLGLVLMGYRVMRSLGNNITYHSPSRGFSMELAALTTVLWASATGTSVSTTHCICGATVGVGLCAGDVRAVNWRMVAWTTLGWLFTLPFAGAVSGLLFALVAHSPKAYPAAELRAIAVGRAVADSPGGAAAVGACLRAAARNATKVVGGGV